MHHEPENPLRVLLATSEAAPFAKTGGLSDVCGSLPVELSRLGHRVTVMLPAYRQVFESGMPIEPTDVELTVSIGGKSVTGRLLRSHLPESDVRVYLLQQDKYYDRPGLYGEDGQDYVDNCERFVFFCRAVMASIAELNLQPDILHANDWTTGLLPAYLSTEYSGVPGYEQIASVFTIHNLAYQGQFWHWDMLLTGLDWKYYNWHQLEFFGHLNLMKAGLVFADALTTVSPRYAAEIQTPELGCGLEGVLAHRRDVLSGILNGVDYTQWNPETDAHLEANYSLEDLSGKAACKAALQRELGLPERAEVPLLGFVGRLVDQKGLDLAAPIISQWVQSADVQWAILGSGDPKYHQLLAELAAAHPDKVAVRLEFSEPLAHRIEAGADVFLMPSHYEPCGLNQLYSLKYGAVPLVHATGGLADTITDASEDNLRAGTANGFSFDEYSTKALGRALRRAWKLYADRGTWRRLMITGMRQDWSWARSARQYVDLYRDTLKRVRQQVAL